MKKIEKNNICRLCESVKLKKFVDFGKIGIGNNLLKKKSLSKEAQQYPLSIIVCKDCNHYQLSHYVNEKILFAKNYTYLTGIAKDFILHFLVLELFFVFCPLTGKPFLCLRPL